MATRTDKTNKIPNIPRGRFVDKDFYQAEINHVFKKTWLMVGHISEYECDGKYRLLDLPFAPVFIVRGHDGVLRSFLNSCPHRGANVLRKDEGVAKIFTCGFHGWSFDNTGKLKGLPCSEGFPNICKETTSLDSLRCELWGGFIFINFDKEAQDLISWLGPLADRYSKIVNAPLRVVSRKSYISNCNWKVMEDAFRETYHVNVLHRHSIAPMVDTNSAFNEFYPNGHCTMFVPYSQSAANSMSMQETTLPKMPGTEEDIFTKNILATGIFPNVLLSFQSGGFPIQQYWPLGVDKCRFDAVWFGMDWGDSEKPREWEEQILPAFEIIANEDFINLASVQASIEANIHKSMPLHNIQEAPIYQFHSEVDRLIGENNIKENLRVPNVMTD